MILPAAADLALIALVVAGHAAWRHGLFAPAPGHHSRPRRQNPADTAIIHTTTQAVPVVTVRPDVDTITRLRAIGRPS